MKLKSSAAVLKLHFQSSPPRPTKPAWMCTHPAAVSLYTRTYWSVSIWNGDTPTSTESLTTNWSHVIVDTYMNWILYVLSQWVHFWYSFWDVLQELSFWRWKTCERVRALRQKSTVRVPGVKSTMHTQLVGFLLMLPDLLEEGCLVYTCFQTF